MIRYLGRCTKRSLSVPWPVQNHKMDLEHSDWWTWGVAWLLRIQLLWFDRALHAELKIPCNSLHCIPSSLQQGRRKFGPARHGLCMSRVFMSSNCMFVFSPGASHYISHYISRLPCNRNGIAMTSIVYFYFGLDALFHYTQNCEIRL